jgi:hypothetical protein
VEIDNAGEMVNANEADDAEALAPSATFTLKL